MVAREPGAQRWPEMMTEIVAIMLLSVKRLTATDTSTADCAKIVTISITHVRC